MAVDDKLFGVAAPTVVHDVSLTIERGEVFALVGESGSGRSTIAKAISGLLAPFAGQLRFDDDLPPGTVEERSAILKRRIQCTFQNPDASRNPRARVRTSLARPIVKFLSVSRSDVGVRIATALGEVRLPESYAIHYPDQLSGGERQRVALARALVARPDLLLCDEVLSSANAPGNLEAAASKSRRRGARFAQIYVFAAIITWKTLNASPAASCSITPAWPALGMNGHSATATSPSLTLSAKSCAKSVG